MPTKVCIVKAMIFPVVVCGCESWTMKKAVHRRIDAFKLWHWRRLWRVPWTARRSNQSILKEISPEYSLEGLMLKLKLRYFGHLVWKKQCIGEDPDAGKDWEQEEKRVSEDEMSGWHHWCNGHELQQTSGGGEGQGGLVCCSPRAHKELDMTGWLNNNNCASLFRLLEQKNHRLGSFKKQTLGTSLAVQWLRHRTPNAGDQGSILIRELDPTCCN